MDLKQLLNQTKIGVNEEVDVTDSTLTEEDTVTETVSNNLDMNTAFDDEQNIDDEQENLSEDDPSLDERFARPWNKLEKGSKMNRILLFVEMQKKEHLLTDTSTKALKNLLFKACENGLFNKISDVKYNQETGEIESFKNLEFNESTKKYKLKTGGTKNRSISKSRSNIDRLTKKK